jgi:outer membrane receptor protein involved in Fe transport
VTKNAANFALRYDGDGFSLRLAYNWNSRSLVDVNRGGSQCWDDYCPGGTSADPARAGATDTWWGLPKYQEAYGQWDLGGSYNFNSKFSMSFSVSNLNNVTVRETYQQNNTTVGTAWRFPGQTYNLSGRMEF